MYEHLTRAAQAVVKGAGIYADELGQEYVGTEHVLLAIAAQRGDGAAQLLARHRVGITALREKIEQLVKDQLSDDLVLGSLPSTLHLQHMMTHAIEWSRKLKRTQVNTRHLLLAVIEEQHSVARVALLELGVDLDALRKDLLTPKPAKGT